MTAPFFRVYIASEAVVWDRLAVFMPLELYA